MTAQEAGVAVAQGGAGDRNGGSEPGLMEGEDVHIAFHDPGHPLSGQGAAGGMEAVEHLSLMVDTRLRRIKILGLTFSNHPSAESDDALMEVKDGKKDPSPKSVIPTLFLFRKDQRKSSTFRWLTDNLNVPTHISHDFPPDSKIRPGPLSLLVNG